MPSLFFSNEKHKDCSFPSVFGMEAQFSESERGELVEVVDNNDRPLLCMSPKIALRQRLSIRMVAVALRTRLNRLILRKRHDVRLGYTGRWDMYTGFVLIGEAREDAALRLLLSDAGLSGLRVSLLSDREEPEEYFSRFTLYVTDLPAELYPSQPAHEMMTVDADELAGLIRDVPELLCPALIRAAAAPGLLRDY